MRSNESPATAPAFTAGDRLAAAVARFQRRGFARPVGLFINIAALFVTIAPLREGRAGFVEAAPLWFLAIARAMLIVWARRRCADLYARHRYVTVDNSEHQREFWELVVGKRAPHNERAWLLFDAQGEIVRENWAEARTLFERLDATSPIPDWLVKNDLAFTMAMMGEGQGAVRIATKVVELAEKIPARSELEKKYRNDVLDVAHSTLGESLCVAGEYKRAAEILEPLVGQSKTALAARVRRYFYAQCLVGLDRLDEAAEVLRANVEGDSPWAVRSREALARLNTRS